MKKPMSLRLRLTMLCAALLTLCCLLLTLTNNLSAVQMAHSVQAVPLLPAQTAEADAHTDFPMASLEINATVRQARGVFHLQSLLAMAAVLANIQHGAPKTFPEALQLFWLYALMAGVINYGRLDDLLGPYLAADLEAGRLTEDEAYEYVKCL